MPITILSLDVFGPNLRDEPLHIFTPIFVYNLEIISREATHSMHHCRDPTSNTVQFVSIQNHLFNNWFTQELVDSGLRILFLATLTTSYPHIFRKIERKLNKMDIRINHSTSASIFGWSRGRWYIMHIPPLGDFQLLSATSLSRVLCMHSVMWRHELIKAGNVTYFKVF